MRSAKELVAEAIGLHGVDGVLAALSDFAKTFGSQYEWVAGYPQAQIGSNWRVIREVTATLSNLPFPDDSTNEGD